MRELLRFGAAGAVLAAVLAGCEDRGLQEGQVPWKDTNIESLDGMKDQMAKNLRAQAARAAEAPKAPDAAQSAEAPKAPAATRSE